MRLAAFPIVLFLILSFSCSSNKVVIAKDVVKAETPEETSISNGKSLYENNCSICHDLPKPNSYTLEKWNPILKRMQVNAKITNEERESIYFYISKVL